MTLRKWLEAEQNGYYGRMAISAVLAAAFFLVSWLWINEDIADALARMFGYMFITTAVLNLGAGGAISAVRKRLDWKETKIDDARL
jgi:hypothetical protein